MTKPRSQLVCVKTTPYYHCISRCVRRAFLCGNDPITKKSYEHRRLWVEKKLLQINKFFMIDIASYAIMSNHYHLVLHINSLGAKQLSDIDVVKRWHGLFKPTDLSQRFEKNLPIDEGEVENLNQTIALWRTRLCDIGWFMRCINEPLARMANKEDKCTGRFWEGRFRSQALLDEKSLLACMAYVDLNPIRAGIASKLENSKHTSIKKRVNNINLSNISSFNKLEFINSNLESSVKTLPFSLKDYLNLVDWTANQLQKNKQDQINSDAPFILNRFDLSKKHWIYLSQNFECLFKNFVGCAYKLKSATKAINSKRCSGLTNCLKFFG